MKIKANPIYKPSNFQTDEWQVEKLVELPASEFDALVAAPLAAHPVIAENKKHMFSDGGTLHALLVLGEGRKDGVLVESEGHDFVHLGAYVPDARDIVQTRLDRAVDFIIREGTENTGNGNWRVYFDDLERRLGLTIRDGNGLDDMLLDAMCSRPEVADVVLTDECVDAVYYLAYCKNLEEMEDIPAVFSWERAAELLDNAVSAALGLFQGEDSYTMLHDSFGMTLQEIQEHRYLSEKELMDICHVPWMMLGCCMSVQYALEQDDIPGSAVLSHKDSTVLVPLDDLKRLTASGREDFAALLDARVADIRVDDGIPELVLEGVGAAELERLHDTLEAHEQAEQAMGDMTP